MTSGTCRRLIIKPRDFRSNFSPQVGERYLLSVREGEKRGREERERREGDMRWGGRNTFESKGNEQRGEVIMRR